MRVWHNSEKKIFKNFYVKMYLTCGEGCKTFSFSDDPGFRLMYTLIIWLIWIQRSSITTNSRKILWNESRSYAKTVGEFIWYVVRPFLDKDWMISTIAIWNMPPEMKKKRFLKNENMQNWIQSLTRYDLTHFKVNCYGTNVQGYGINWW